MKIDYLSLRQILLKIKKRELSCLKVAEHFANNIKKNSHLNSIIYFNYEQCLEDATKLDKLADSGKFSGRLHGAPLVIKDNIHVKGVPNTAGSPALQNFIPKHDAPVAKTLRNEGALFIAKANLHELSFGVTTNNGKFGTCKNSKNNEYFPGGSSGGTGSSIGAHLAPAGLGTDTGGSVRIPSSVNGICGLRPTHLRYSNFGVTPLSFSRDTIGPMANFVDDLILLDEIITGDKFDYSSDNRSLSGIRLGVSSDYLCSDLDLEVGESFEMAKRVLENNGATLVEVDSRSLKQTNEDSSFDFLFYETNHDLSQYLFQNEIGLSLEDLSKKIGSPDVKELFKKVLNNCVKKNSEYYELMHVKRPALKRAYQEMFNKYNLNAIVFPTLPCLPARIDSKEVSISSFIRNMDPGSQAGILNRNFLFLEK
jgi:indoleacetamide hydrolase